MADESDREQQDRRGDRDEDVVEAGDQAELLLVDRGRRALAFGKSAKRGRAIGGDGTGGDGFVEIVLAVQGGRVDRAAAPMVARTSATSASGRAMPGNCS